MNQQKKSVLVTRPQHQSAEFIALLDEHDFTGLAFPSIEIGALKLTPQLEQTLRVINNYDLIVFISANAVHQALSLLQQLDISPAAITANIATIGKATQKAANDAGFNVNLSPQQGFNSEALLALNELQAVQIKNSRGLIIRGVGGLENLADELRRRGMQVNYAQVYERRLPQHDGEIKRQQLGKNWDSFAINAITVSSNEVLQNLYDMLELSNASLASRTSILDTRIIVASSRSVTLAKSLGFTQIFCAQSALNQHMLEALKNAFE